jgi:hypothetical protein
VQEVEKVLVPAAERRTIGKGNVSMGTRLRVETLSTQGALSFGLIQGMTRVELMADMLRDGNGNSIQVIGTQDHECLLIVQDLRSDRRLRSMLPILRLQHSVQAATHVRQVNNRSRTAKPLSLNR